MAFLKDRLPPPTDSYILSSTTNPSPPPSTSLTVIPSTPSPKAGVSKIVPLPKSPNGSVDYSAIVRQAENASRTVHTSATALVEKPRSEALNPLPTQPEADATTARTRQALQKVLDGKIAAARTTHPDKLAHGTEAVKPAFMRYTPANANVGDDSGRPQQRIIKMVEAPTDPMLPPRFAHKKAPVNPPSPPVPVMHSPERKLSREEAAQWHIPPVVSNWKNNRGYTISLEKRLAADGRGSVDHSINDRFAEMADALYKAERSARADVEKRAQMQQKVALRAKEAKERELRELAERARRERRGYLGLSEATDTESMAPRSEAAAGSVVGEDWMAQTSGERRVRDDAPPVAPAAALVGQDRGGSEKRPRRKSRFTLAPGVVSGVASETRPSDEGWKNEGPEDGVDNAEVKRRDAIREERRWERERELRQSRMVHGESTGPTLKRSKLSRDADRDLAERVALGQSLDEGGKTGEVLYDQRLFNQDGRVGGSLAGGYGADDAYNLYDRPLFVGKNASSQYQYKPPRGSTEDEDEASAAGERRETRASQGTKRRDRPVEFERDTELKSSANDDPFGLDKFMDEAKRFEKS